MVVGAMFVLVACGGTTPSGTQGGAGATAGPGATTGATAPAVTTPTATQSGGGGGGGTGTYTGKVCDLVTVAEVEGVLGATGVTATETPIQNNAGFCLYGSPDGAVVATSLIGGATAGPTWTTYSTSFGADGVAISGLGDGAVFVKSSGSLFLWKSGLLIGITAGTSQAPEAQRMEWEKKIAAFIAGRL
jgi:hypothetical protein